MGDVIEVYTDNVSEVFVVWYRDGVRLGGHRAFGTIPSSQNPVRWWRYTSLEDLYTDFGWLKKDMRFAEHLIVWGII